MTPDSLFSILAIAIICIAASYALGYYSGIKKGSQIGMERLDKYHNDVMERIRRL